jgi:perosamine synthetase
MQALDIATSGSSGLALPRGPVLGWSSFEIVNTPAIAGLENLPYTAVTTSGRAAIYQALKQLRLPAQSIVLVPTYHCPTMIAPVILAKLQMAYFGLRPDGLPRLETIDAATALNAKAMIVSHYFGLAHSLAEVRQWCDERSIALIEDCAHCYFGNAGERPVGAWGDFSTASLSKFLPVPEGGLLGSSKRPIEDLRLRTPGFIAQIKGWVDVMERASRHNRFTGMNGLLALIFRLKNKRLRPKPVAGNGAVSGAEALADAQVEAMMRDCDMARIDQAPLWASTTLKNVLPRGRIIARRQQNYACYSRHFDSVAGARPLFALPKDSASQIAPYVFPLWVDDADRIYEQLRAQELPVFRWDRIWPGTPQLDGDVGPLWSRHVLQLLCHQDLDLADIERTSRAVSSLLSSQL